VSEGGLRVEVWSDVVCPWCWIGRRRLSAALARLPGGDAVEVVWRSFELAPHARSAVARPAAARGYGDRRGATYGLGAEGGRRMADALIAEGAAEGLDLRLDRTVRANTFDAHQVIHLAAGQGLQEAVAERLMTAYFTEGEALGDREVLVRLGADAGLDTGEVRAALADQRFAAAVRADEEEALDRLVGAVPYILIDGVFAVPGAQPAEAILRLVERARARRGG
jgi:predicted DsbA family dithiol-disulfide isomerase